MDIIPLGQGSPSELCGVKIAEVVTDGCRLFCGARGF